MTEVDVTKLPIQSELTGPLAERVYLALKSAILSLDFAPGALIRKSAVCARFEASRSPVSDALNKLSGEGLVDVVPQSGTRVSRLSMAAIREEAFLREALEAAAARRAALHRTDEEMARLNRNVEMQKLLVADGDREDFFETDNNFHEIIMAMTGVTRLPVAVRAWSMQVDRARQLLMPEPGSLSVTVSEHIEILEAIRAQDEIGAQDAMSRHVRQLVKRLEPLEAVRPDVFST